MVDHPSAPAFGAAQGRAPAVPRGAWRWAADAWLVGLVAAVFGRVLGFGFIAFDDVGYILQNPEVNGANVPLIDRLLTPTVGYVVPVTVNFERLLHALGDGDAFAFHAAALLLHAGFAVQLFRFSLALSARWPAALLGASLFAVHPLCVQPVSWAICLKDLLMANLALGATRCLVAAAADGRRAKARAGLGAVALATLATLAKPSAALLGLAWLCHLAARRAARQPVAPWGLRAASWAALLGVGVGGASALAHGALTPGEGPPDWSAWYVPAVLGRQLANAAWPAELLITYPNPPDATSDPYAYAGALAIGALALLAYRLRRAPGPMLLLALGVFAYLPTSNVVPFARVISDSYMYLPLACVAAALALGFSRLIASRSTERRASAALLAGAAAVVVLSWASFQQLPRYRGGDALWQPVVRAHPALAEAHRLYGDELMFRGHPARAVARYVRAFHLQYDPRFLGELGTALSMAGELEQAECVLIEATAYGTAPGYAAHNYAVLMAFHPSYDSRHPAAAKSLLERIDRLRRDGALAWPSELLPGLQAQLAKLRDVPAAELAWPARNCAALRGVSPE